MTAKILVVGFQRADRDPEGPAFEGEGPTTRRLAELFGSWPRPDVTAVNLLEGWTVGWTASYSRLRAEEVLDIYPQRTVILCGTKVRAAFLVDDWFSWHDLFPRQLGAIPHPSGRTRLWNDPAVVAQAKAFIASAVPS